MIHALDVPILCNFLAQRLTYFYFSKCKIAFFSQRESNSTYPHPLGREKRTCREVQPSLLLQRVLLGDYCKIQNICAKIMKEFKFLPFCSKFKHFPMCIAMVLLSFEMHAHAVDWGSIRNLQIPQLCRHP